MDWGFIIAVVVTGLVVVFVVLALLILFVSLVGLIIRKATGGGQGKKEADTETSVKKEAEPKIVAAQVQPAVEKGIPGAVVAAIAAAISAISDGKKLAIRSIKRSGDNRSAWASAGVAENTRPF